MSRESSTSKEELVEWLSIALKDEQIENIKIIACSPAAVDEGFSSQLDFVRLTGDQKGQSVQLDVVVKNGRRGEDNRQGDGLRNAFKQELFIYDQVFPRLHQLESERQIADRFSAFARFYKGMIFDDNEVLVFENLKTKGYKLNEKLPMDWQHKDLVLKQYAKYHALNFALRDQYYEEYKKLAGSLINVTASFFENDACYILFLKSVEECNGIYKKHNREDILAKVGHIGRKEIYELQVATDLDCDPYSVIIHGDNWNNNFMFKYSDASDKVPEKVAILDWQLAAKASPMCDILKFFYCNSEPADYDDYEKFIDLYYEYFSSHLEKLGSDPKKLYPKHLAKQHWKQFAKNSFLVLPIILKVRFADKNTM